MSIYLDNQTTARIAKEVVEAMTPFFREAWGTPAAPHQMGQALNDPLKQAAQALYQFVGAQDKDHFVLTSSGAEAVNHVVFAAYMDITRKTGKNHFVTSTLDEAPAIMALERLQELGCIYQLAPAKLGKVTVDSIAETITPRTALVSLSWACGLTGVIHPVRPIAALCKERGILFHVDATHVLGKGYFLWEECGADILTFNGEQLHGPKGTGGLFIRDGIEISPLIIGGNEQTGLRGGSLNVPGWIGLAKAVELAEESCAYVCTEIARLRTHFEEVLLTHIPGAKVYFREEERLPHVTAIHFPGVTSDALLYLMNRKGVYASLGGGNFQQIAHLMRASGIESHCTLSFSLSRDTTLQEIEEGAAKIIEAYGRLRKCSQFLVSL